MLRRNSEFTAVVAATLAPGIGIAPLYSVSKWNIGCNLLIFNEMPGIVEFRIFLGNDRQFSPCSRIKMVLALNGVTSNNAEGSMVKKTLEVICCALFFFGIEAYSQQPVTNIFPEFTAFHHSLRPLHFEGGSVPVDANGLHIAVITGNVSIEPTLSVSAPCRTMTFDGVGNCFEPAKVSPLRVPAIFNIGGSTVVANNANHRVDLIFLAAPSYTITLSAAGNSPADSHLISEVQLEPEFNLSTIDPREIAWAQQEEMGFAVDQGALNFNLNPIPACVECFVPFDLYSRQLSNIAIPSTLLFLPRNHDHRFVGPVLPSGYLLIAHPPGPVPQNAVQKRNGPGSTTSWWRVHRC